MSGQLPYRCPRCGDHKRFRSLSSLRAHLEYSHTYETLYVLSKSCRVPGGLGLTGAGRAASAIAAGGAASRGGGGGGGVGGGGRGPLALATGGGGAASSYERGAAAAAAAGAELAGRRAGRLGGDARLWVEGPVRKVGPATETGEMLCEVLVRRPTRHAWYSDPPDKHYRAAARLRPLAAPPAPGRDNCRERDSGGVGGRGTAGEEEEENEDEEEEDDDDRDEDEAASESSGGRGPAVRTCRLEAELVRQAADLGEAQARSRQLGREKEELARRVEELSRQVDASAGMIAALRQELLRKERELHTKEQEAARLTEFLQATAEREGQAKVELQRFIEGLLDRAERAEGRLLALGAATVAAGHNPAPSSVDARTAAVAQTGGPEPTTSGSEQQARARLNSGEGKEETKGSDFTTTSKKRHDRARGRSPQPGKGPAAAQSGAESGGGDADGKAAGGSRGGAGRGGSAPPSSLRAAPPPAASRSRSGSRCPRASAASSAALSDGTESGVSEASGSGSGSPGGSRGGGARDPRRRSEPAGIQHCPASMGAGLPRGAGRSRRGEDALCLVFSYLDVRSLLVAGEVCVEWNTVARSPRLWARVVLENARVSSKFLVSLSARCSLCRSLVLHNLKPRPRRKGESREEHAATTRGCLEAGLEALMKVAGPRLLALRVSDCPHVLTERVLWLAGCHSRKLQALTYRSSTDPVSAQGLWSLSAGCPDVVSLQVAPGYPCAQEELFDNGCLQMIGRCWPNLRALGIGGRGCDIQGLAALVRSCRELRGLELDRVLELSQEGAAALCEPPGLRCLEVLALVFTPVTPRALLHFSECCPSLKSVLVHVGISDYFTDADDPESQRLYRELMDKLQALKKRPELANVLHIKADYG
ncbi:F-box only protein 41 isoform X1 [Petromyzon marinus]|uniref:F-box only protein 41 isoform X1 n=1 Tax=Petromyzon marinus TaxID=7757 RepID=UPI003F71EA54